MNKKVKLIFSAFISFVIVYYVYYFAMAILFSYRIELNNYERYRWIFSEKIWKDVYKDGASGFVKPNDIYYNYKFKNLYVSIWEFKNIGVSKYEDIVFQLNRNLNKIEFNEGEIWNKDYRHFPKISVKPKILIKNTLQVNLNEYSEVQMYFDSLKYTGFFGVINKMSFSDHDGEDLILFDYGQKQQESLVLFYLKNSRLYFILVNSAEPLNEGMIEIFNL